LTAFENNSDPEVARTRGARDRTRGARDRTRGARDRTRGARAAFTLIELLIGLAITAGLMTAMLMAMQASFRGYQASVEQASTHMTGRVISQRILTLVRTGDAFGPLPADPRDRFVVSDTFSVTSQDGAEITLRLDRPSATLFVSTGGGEERTLLAGVRGPINAEGAELGAFTLEFEKGTTLLRASFDLVVEGDPEAQLAIEGDEVIPLRLVGTASPRREPW
jgi:prepilin-type N-terminal cleavage/methylation domain-containing protein